MVYKIFQTFCGDFILKRRVDNEPLQSMWCVHCYSYKPLIGSSIHDHGDHVCRAILFEKTIGNSKCMIDQQILHVPHAASFVERILEFAFLCQIGISRTALTLSRALYQSKCTMYVLVSRAFLHTLRTWCSLSKPLAAGWVIPLGNFPHKIQYLNRTSCYC